MTMNEKTKQFALAHADDDVRQLALKGCRDAEVDLSTALQQISGRQVARCKVPSWAALNEIRYPVHLSMEQCSSEVTACYKNRLIAQIVHTTPTLSIPSGPTPFLKLVDLTGGFGVDFSFLCRLFDEGIYVERDEALCAIAHHNLHVLSDEMEPLHFSVVNAGAEEFLHRMEEHVTLIFIDPARRDKRGARTYSLSDCTPNVLPLMDELLAKADYVLLKLSPMLDWRKAMADVGSEYVEQVHIVAVGGECKELLLLLSAKGCKQALLVCTNDDKQEVFEMFPTPPSNFPQMGEAFTAESGTVASPSWEGATFLYEPHSALMKAGFFAELAQRYGVTPIAPNSHLFTSVAPVDNFPGRIFRITAVSSMNKQELKEKVQPLKQANISVRNFPMSADALRKKLKLSEGGSNYLFATTLADGRHILFVCQKVN